jgi:hypothetical protein
MSLYQMIMSDDIVAMLFQLYPFSDMLIPTTDAYCPFYM